MSYEDIALRELRAWQGEMVSSPSLFNRLSKKLQVKMNSFIPEKIHQVITATIKQMIKGVLFGARQITKESSPFQDLQATEVAVEKIIRNYKHTASVEGGVTGAGGILIGLADFPLLLAIKIKMLFDIASVYGFDVQDYKERVYLLHIFQLAFSSHEHRKHIYLEMNDWENQKHLLPDDINQFDWRNFQLEYRDYIDLAKMAQLVPGIGAVVGVVVNYKLVKKLGLTAMNAYRMRIFQKQTFSGSSITGT
jgi:hypothetical protein